jgi:hypothetical protein
VFAIVACKARESLRLERQTDTNGIVERGWNRNLLLNL